MSVWDNYDKWKLSTPWDNEPDIEIFESQCGNYFTFDELEMNRFEKSIDHEVELALDEYDDMDNLIENIADDFKLYESREDALIGHSEFIEEQRIEYLEHKANYRR